MELLDPGLPSKLNPQHLIQVSAGKENKITARLAAAYGGLLSSTITQWQREAPIPGTEPGAPGSLESSSPAHPSARRTRGSPLTTVASEYSLWNLWQPLIDNLEPSGLTTYFSIVPKSHFGSLLNGIFIP